MVEQNVTLLGFDLMCQFHICATQMKIISNYFQFALPFHLILSLVHIAKVFMRWFFTVGIGNLNDNKKRSSFAQFPFIHLSAFLPHRCGCSKLMIFYPFTRNYVIIFLNSINYENDSWCKAAYLEQSVLVLRESDFSRSTLILL